MSVQYLVFSIGIFAVQKTTENLVDGVPTFSTVHTNVAYDVSTRRLKCIKDGLHLFTFGIGTLVEIRLLSYLYE